MSKKWKDLKGIIHRRGAVQKLKSLNPDFLKNIRSESGRNLLQVSNKHENREVSEYLKSIGCTLNENIQNEDLKNTTLLRRIIYANYAGLNQRKTLELLLNNGADISWEIVGGTNYMNNFKKKHVFQAFRTHIRNKFSSSLLIAEYLISKNWPLDGIACLQDDKITMDAVRLNGLEDQYCQLLNAIKEGNVSNTVSLIKPLKFSRIIMDWALLEAVRSEKPTASLIIKIIVQLGKTGTYVRFSNRFFRGLSPLQVAMKNNNIKNTSELLALQVSSSTYFCQVIYEALIGCSRKRPSYFDFLLALSEYVLYYKHHEHLSFRIYETSLKLIFMSYSRDLFYGFINDDFFTFPVVKWLTKLHHCGLDITPYKNELFSQYLRIFEEQYNEFDAHFEECEKEILKMKDCKVENVHVYDILTRSIDVIVPLTRNEIFMETANSILNSNNFPLYNTDLQLKMKECCERRNMIDQTLNILSECLPLIGSNHLITEKIAYYLDVPNFLI